MFVGLGFEGLEDVFGGLGGEADLENFAGGVGTHARGDVSVVFCPFLIANVRVFVGTTESDGAGGVEWAGEVSASLGYAPEFFVRAVAGCARGINLRVVFRADVVVQKIIEEVSNNRCV